MMNSLNDSIHQDWKVREARRASAAARYHVTVRPDPNHRTTGERIAEVRDRSMDDSVIQRHGSFYDGAMFYILALEHAKLLNKG